MTGAPGAVAAEDSPWSPRYRAASVGMVTLVTLVAFEAMAVATAMPVVARSLGGLREYGLAFSLFLAASLVGMAAAGGWNDARGPRRPLGTGLALFCTGLVLSGTADSFGAFLLGRAVSGLGGGLQVVTLYVVVASVFPAALQPRVFGVISAAWVLPSVLGPPVAGLLAEQVSWRLVFLGVPPVALLPFVVLWPRLRRPAGAVSSGAVSGGAVSGGAVSSGAVSGGAVSSGEPVQDPGPAPETARSPRPDAVVAQPGLVAPAGRAVLVLRGAGLATGTVLLQWGLTGAGPLPSGPVVVIGLVLAVAGGPGLLPRGVLVLRRGLASLVVCRALFAGTFFGAETFVPLMLVTHRGVGPALAGVALTTGAIGWSVGSFLQGRGLLRLSRTGLLGVGGTVVAASVLALTPTPWPQVPTWLLPAVWAVGGTGMGLAMSSTSVLTLRLSVPGEEGRNSAALQIGDVLGSVLGVGAAGAIFAALHSEAVDGPADGRVFTLIWLLLGLVALLSWPVSRRVANAGRDGVARRRPARHDQAPR